MSDGDKKSDAPLVSGETFSGEAGNTNLVYILYLVGLVIGPIILVGVIIAYVNQGNATDWVKDHYRYQIRTFWIAMLYSIISVVLMVVVVGIFLAIATAVWWIVRCIKGMQAANRGEAPANVAGWGF